MDFGISNGYWLTSVGPVWCVVVVGFEGEGDEDNSDTAMHGDDDAKDYVVGWGWYEGWRWWIQESTCLARPTRATLGSCALLWSSSSTTTFCVARPTRVALGSCAQF